MLRGFAAVGAAAAIVVLCATAWAGGDAPDKPTILMFSGTDLWRDSGFLYGGLLWSPAGFATNGFTLKLLLDGGGYTYPSGGLHEDVGGRLLSAAAMPGFRMIGSGVTVSLFAGPLVQDYRLTPDDPGSRLRGSYAGGQLEADIWLQPNSETIVALDGGAASIGPTGWLRAAVGAKVLAPLFIGPEAETFWCADYEQLRVGARLIGWQMGALNWGGAAGWAVDSEGRAGPYLRLDLSAQY